jgi:hypothetical protein
MGEAAVSFFARLLSPSNPLWLFYPLCAVVALVYKATKFDGARRILREAVRFFLEVSLGMLALAIFFYILSEVC